MFTKRLLLSDEEAPDAHLLSDRERLLKDHNVTPLLWRGHKGHMSMERSSKEGSQASTERLGPIMERWQTSKDRSPIFTDNDMETFYREVRRRSRGHNLLRSSLYFLVVAAAFYTEETNAS